MTLTYYLCFIRMFLILINIIYFYFRIYSFTWFFLLDSRLIWYSALTS